MSLTVLGRYNRPPCRFLFVGQGFRDPKIELGEIARLHPTQSAASYRPTTALRARRASVPREFRRKAGTVLAAADRALEHLGGPITMKAAMAIALIACDLALWTIAASSSGWRIAGQVGAALAGVIGALMLAEHLFRSNLHDELSVNEALAPPPRRVRDASVRTDR